MRENRLRKSMAQGKTLAGMGVSAGNEALIEIIGGCGYDFILIDTEHTQLCHDIGLQNLVRTADASGLSTVIRVPANDEVLIRKSFEFGAEAVVIPHARTADEVRRMVEAAHFPPLGIRGSATDVRSAGYGTEDGFSRKEYFERSNRDVMVIPMAEDREFFENIDEIMEVEGVAGFLFGAHDLSLSMGLMDGSERSKQQIADKLAELARRIKERGLVLVTPVSPMTCERVEQLAGLGARMLIFGTDLGNFRAAAKDIANRLIVPLKS